MTPIEWLEDRYHIMSGTYRRDLMIIVRTCNEWAEGNIWEERHTMTAIQLLNEVKVLPLGSYNGTATDADREHFKTCHKPDFGIMLLQAISQLPNVTPATG